MSLVIEASANAVEDAERRHQFTDDEYVAACAAGVFGDRRTELLYGEIYDMPPQNDAHMLAISELAGFIRPKLSYPSQRLIVQGTMRPGGSLPEPDLAVLNSSIINDKVTLDTKRPVWLIEVCDSSHRRDLHLKPSLYFAMGTPEYWVVDLQNRKLIVHQRNDSAARAATYTQIDKFVEGDVVAPQFNTDLAIDLRKLFRFHLA